LIGATAAASLIDAGEGILFVELHSKMNIIGAETLAAIREAVDRAERDFQALVIGTRADPFSAGADLAMLARAIDARRWDDVDRMIRAFQDTNLAIAAAAVPVVAAAGGLTLGGGCEICLHAARVHAAAETYMGLVESGVGLIPAAGGSKEMVVRASDSQDLALRFQRVALASVSTSALEARRFGYLRETDPITMNRDRLRDDAKATALSLAIEGYQPRPLRTGIRVGGADALARMALGVHLALRGGRISEFDATVARKLAWVLAGGDLPHAADVSERYLLDLEREAFLSLCGEPKTLARIRHTLSTGKPLRS
jgi:3-hydroxyacyl-CoA dehydrogenase